VTFMCPAAYQNPAVIQIGVNKIPTNFDALFATSLYGVWLFKGSVCDIFICRLALKG
jgi:hypothetical protein